MQLKYGMAFPKTDTPFFSQQWFTHEQLKEMVGPGKQPALRNWLQEIGYMDMQDPPQTLIDKGDLYRMSSYRHGEETYAYSFNYWLVEEMKKKLSLGTQDMAINYITHHNLIGEAGLQGKNSIPFKLLIRLARQYPGIAGFTQDQVKNTSFQGKQEAQSLLVPELEALGAPLTTQEKTRQLFFKATFMRLNSLIASQDQVLEGQMEKIISFLENLPGLLQKTKQEEWPYLLAYHLDPHNIELRQKDPRAELAMPVELQRFALIAGLPKYCSGQAREHKITAGGRLEMFQELYCGKEFITILKKMEEYLALPPEEYRDFIADFELPELKMEKTRHLKKYLDHIRDAHQVKAFKVEQEEDSVHQATFLRALERSLEAIEEKTGLTGLWDGLNISCDPHLRGGGLGRFIRYGADGDEISLNSDPQPQHAGELDNTVAHEFFHYLDTKLGKGAFLTVLMAINTPDKSILELKTRFTKINALVQSFSKEYLLKNGSRKSMKSVAEDMDKGKQDEEGKPREYWSREYEMAARSFAEWVTGRPTQLLLDLKNYEKMPESFTDQARLWEDIFQDLAKKARPRPLAP